MQPYLFPYLGYFQLISAANVFVLSDDLQYINKGWINRNRILINGAPALINFPLKKGKELSRINERVLSDDFSAQMERLFRTFKTVYAKAPCYRTVMPFIEEVIRFPGTNLATYTENAVRKICRHLDITTPIVISSDLDIGEVTDKSDRIVKTVKKLVGDLYINPIGGLELYDFVYFRKHGVELKFHRMDDIAYRQFGNEFVPHLSIIDVLMFNEVPEVQRMLSCYSLLGASDVQMSASDQSEASEALR